eukprot:2692206-Pleurochrysis_carterae.AAC.3
MADVTVPRAPDRRPPAGAASPCASARSRPSTCSLNCTSTLGSGVHGLKESVLTINSDRPRPWSGGINNRAWLLPAPMLMLATCHSVHICLSVHACLPTLSFPLLPFDILLVFVGCRNHHEGHSLALRTRTRCPRHYDSRAHATHTLPHGLARAPVRVCRLLFKAG